MAIGQWIVSPKLGEGEWLWLSLCSAMYQHFSSAHKNLIRAGHWHWQDLVFFTPAFPWTMNTIYHQCTKQKQRREWMHHNAEQIAFKKRPVTMKRPVTKHPQTISHTHFILLTLSRLFFHTLCQIPSPRNIDCKNYKPHPTIQMKSPELERSQFQMDNR